MRCATIASFLTLVASGCMEVTHCGVTGPQMCQIDDIAGLALAYADLHGSLPQGDIRDLVRALKSDPRLAETASGERHSIDWLGRFEDYRGNALVYHCPPRPGIDAPQGFELYSTGEDGDDDGGEGDDIVYRWRVPFSK